jgi:hypothetical protein
VLLFCCSASSQNYNFSSVGGDGEEGGGELLLGGLGKFMRYSVVVQAFNQVGPGPLSEPVAAQTMEDGEAATSTEHTTVTVTVILGGHCPTS